MSQDRLLNAVSLAEAATGLALIAVPGFVSWLLLGATVVDAGAAAARVAGAALVGLSLASATTGQRLGMTVYGLGVACVLLAQGIWGATSGPLLWPAFTPHIVLAAALQTGARRKAAK